MMTRNINQLLAIGALLMGFLAFVGGDSEDIVARQRDFPIAFDESRINVVFDATSKDLGHIFGHPETV